jgi:hypothetical protein
MPATQRLTSEPVRRLAQAGAVASPKTAAPPVVPIPKTARLAIVTPARVGFLAAAIAIIAGYYLPTERFISPENGLGYALGIVGGSSMLLLLLYPLRKRAPWLRFIGSVKAWFQAHMVLGVLGPILVLFHSNFSLGATNSNAALVAMLIVSGSGIFGRYFYTRIHHGLYGRRATRAELLASANAMRERLVGSQFVPQLLAELEQAEARILHCHGGYLRSLVRPVFVTARTYREQWRLSGIARRELRAAVHRSPVVAQQHASFKRALSRYVARRLKLSREVAEFESYERLFSLWHMLHLPLFFLLVTAGIVHVVAVHVY